MTEVRATSKQGCGLFATKHYNPGDIILDEDALFTFSVNSKEEKQAIRDQFKKSATSGDTGNSARASNKNNSFASESKESLTKDDDISIDHFLSDVVKIPSNVDSQKYANKFLGMIIAAVTYSNAKSDKTLGDDTIAKLLQLYCPPGCSNDDSKGILQNVNQYENEVIELSKKALKFLEQNVDEKSPIRDLLKADEKEILNVMLIWACNAFQGGHVYDVTSRINHSCDFNAAIVSTGSVSQTKQIVKAACKIQPNDEINISYLGSYTYADLCQRRQLLRRDKFFDCHCERCVREENFEQFGKDCKLGDVASSIPCVTCHTRISDRYLDEDTQYDDDEDNEVQYAVRKYAQENDMIDQKVYISEKHGCSTLVPALGATIDKTVDRVITHLDLLERKNERSGQAMYDDTDETDDEILEMTQKLLCLSYSVLGSKHYCTNLLLLQNLGNKLSSLHTTMMCNSMQTGKKRNKGLKGKAANVTEVDMAEVAECIDSLQRCYKFIEGLHLRSHPGHLLGNVTIGISRALVGLGDETSMKFGSEWAEKVDDYFQWGFDGISMCKVVATLKNAWKRKSVDDNDEQQSKSQKKTKRIKI